jgi:hypothetical protein
MPDSQDYRLYLESEFKSIRTLFNAQFDAVHDKLDGLEKKTDRIEIQTTKTNGRVTELEEDVHTELPHTKDGCPNKDVINEMHSIFIAEQALSKAKEKDEVVSHSDKVRVIMVIGIFVSIVLSLIGTFSGRKNHQLTRDLKEEVDMINTPVRTRGGVIEWYPSGVVIDSLKAE